MHPSSSLTPAPRGRDRFVTSVEPTVLYQADGTTVTTAYFESSSYRFPVVELDQVERVEQGGFLQSRRYELWALFRGQRVRIYHSYDHTEFGKVVRALTRAYEFAGLA
jgi:Family of unknown function (DUF6232)